MKIYHAEIMTMTEKGIIPNGYVTIENGIITAVEAGDPTPEEGDLMHTAPGCFRLHRCPHPFGHH